MPAAAYALLATFAVISIGLGILAARIVGPRRPWGPILPAAAAFGALYVVGHRLGWSPGPTLGLYGFEVALPFDIAVALLVAGAVAALQRAVARLFQPQQGRAGRDSLA